MIDRFADNVHKDPRGQLTIFYILLFNQEADTFLESLAVCDVSVVEAFVAVIGGQSDLLRMFFGIRN